MKMEIQQTPNPDWITKMSEIINAKREEESSQKACKGNTYEERND
jgi:hypothetical protein